MIMKVKNIDYIRVVATTPEKTHNQKFLTFETILNRFLVKNYPKNKKKSCHPLFTRCKCNTTTTTTTTRRFKRHFAIE